MTAKEILIYLYLLVKDYVEDFLGVNTIKKKDFKLYEDLKNVSVSKHSIFEILLYNTSKLLVTYTQNK